MKKLKYVVTVHRRVNGVHAYNDPAIDKFEIMATTQERALNESKKIVTKKYGAIFNRSYYTGFSDDENFYITADLEITPDVLKLLHRRAKEDYRSAKHIAMVYLTAKSAWLLDKYRRQDTHIMNVADQIDGADGYQFRCLIK